MGSGSLDARVARRLTAIKYTAVESLPPAAIDMRGPNEVLFALHVTSAVNMNIERKFMFKHPCIVVTVPPDKLKLARGETSNLISHHRSLRSQIHGRD